MADFRVDFRETAADAGMRTFSAVLKTAGSQSLTATDTVNASIAGFQYVTVNPAAASRLVLSGPASVKANAAFSLGSVSGPRDTAIA